MSIITVRNTNQEIVGSELRASRVDWKRLRGLALKGALVASAVGGTIFYMNGGISSIRLRADGVVSRERIAVATPFEGRVAQVFVRPGDHVKQGQKIAVVKSIAISRTLADLAAEKARLASKIAELQGRLQVIVETLPLAKSSATQAASYLSNLKQASAAGLALNRSLHEMTSASLSADEHVARLQAEQKSLAAELDADRDAFAQAVSAYDELSATYADGVLYAAASGDIGATVAPVGQAVTPGSGNIADVFTGEGYVLAYVPSSYLFDVSEGQAVGIKTRNEILNGRIDRILPMDKVLPTDLQVPNRMLERGRLVRIALTESNQLPLDRHVQVTTCYAADCHVGVLHAAFQQMHTALARLVGATISVASAAKELVWSAGSAPQHSSRT